MIKKNNIVVFAGAMPDGAVELVEIAKKNGAAVVVDSSGPVFKKIIAKGGLTLIKPNIEELSELTGKKIKNEEKEIIAASKKLLTKVEYILVSRGEKGAMLISNESVISAKYTGPKHDVYNTVACGDYLLAGFLSVIANEVPRIFRNFALQKQNSEGGESTLSLALKTALISATAKAFGMNEKLTWSQIRNKIKIKV
jgi:fructose-1-phosphate kinase PfkB-like protein